MLHLQGHPCLLNLLFKVAVEYFLLSAVSFCPIALYVQYIHSVVSRNYHNHKPSPVIMTTRQISFWNRPLLLFLLSLNKLQIKNPVYTRRSLLKSLNLNIIQCLNIDSKQFLHILLEVRGEFFVVTRQRQNIFHSLSESR